MTHHLALAFAAVLGLAAAGCVSDTATTGPTAAAPRSAEPIRVRGRCGQINIGTAENPRFVHDPACGSGGSN